MTTRHARPIAFGLAGLLGAAGITHFVRPDAYDRIVPRALPGDARLYTLASGVAELLIAAALSRPRTRDVGGTLAAVFFVAVFPANITMARDYLGSQRISRTLKTLALARLPLQVLLVWAAIAARGGRTPDDQ